MDTGPRIGERGEAEIFLWGHLSNQLAWPKVGCPAGVKV